MKGLRLALGLGLVLGLGLGIKRNGIRRNWLEYSQQTTPTFSVVRTVYIVFAKTMYTLHCFFCATRYIERSDTRDQLESIERRRRCHVGIDRQLALDAGPIHSIYLSIYRLPCRTRRPSWSVSRTFLEITWWSVPPSFPCHFDRQRHRRDSNASGRFVQVQCLNFPALQLLLIFINRGFLWRPYSTSIGLTSAEKSYRVALF